MKGSIKKHVAADGTVTYRVRVDYYDPQGKRRQLQRTFPSKRTAEAGLARWLVDLEPDRAAGTRRAPRTGAPRWAQDGLPAPLGPRACLREIARIASDLQWQRHEVSRDHVTRLLRRIEDYAQAGMDFLEPDEEAPAGTPGALGPAPVPADIPAVRYHVYRLLADGVPFYVGQSSNVPARVRTHISQATGTKPGRSARVQAIRAALAAGRTLSYDIVASATTEQEIRHLERDWIMRLLGAGETLANGSLL